jgi:glutamate/tyrosine decarboxylase-like PLP-dependent enzyme
LLTEVLDVTPPFLRNQSGYGQVTDYRNWGLSLGRRFRSLKILFVLRSFGVAGFQAHLRRTIDLTAMMEKQMQEDADFELVTPRSLGLLVFRLAPEKVEKSKLDELNKRLYANIHKRTGIQLSEFSSSVAKSAEMLMWWDSFNRHWRYLLHTLHGGKPIDEGGAHHGSMEADSRSR